MRFLLDVMCGSLATYLRMCGHDAAYALDRNVEDDDRIRSWAHEEDRRLVTRDEALAAREEGALLVRSLEVADQLRELRDAGVPVSLPDEPSRCGRCNGPLERLPDDAERPAYVPDHEADVWRCADCGQCFWRGSHWERVEETLRSL